jgi:hypothetical protein
MLRACVSVCLFVVLAVLAGLASQAAGSPLPAAPVATTLGAASLMAGVAESMGPKMRP